MGVPDAGLVEHGLPAIGRCLRALRPGLPFFQNGRRLAAGARLQFVMLLDQPGRLVAEGRDLFPSPLAGRGRGDDLLDRRPYAGWKQPVFREGTGRLEKRAVTVRIERDRAGFFRLAFHVITDGLEVRHRIVKDEQGVEVLQPFGDRAVPPRRRVRPYLRAGPCHSQ